MPFLCWENQDEKKIQKPTSWNVKTILGSPFAITRYPSFLGFPNNASLHLFPLKFLP